MTSETDDPYNISYINILNYMKMFWKISFKPAYIKVISRKYFIQICSL